MDDKLRQAGGAFVAVPAVDQQKTPDVRELAEREVTGEAGLFSLFSLDPHPDTGRLDHANIVSSVPDRSRPTPSVTLWCTASHITSNESSQVSVRDS